MKIKSIRDIKISTKLVLLGAVSILGMFLLGQESVATAWKIDQAGAELNDVWMNAVITAEELNTATSDYRIRESRHALTTDPELLGELEALNADIQEKFLAYEALPTRAEDQEIIRRAKTVWQEYLACGAELRETGKGVELMTGRSQELFDEASRLFLDAVEQTKREVLAERQQSSRLYRDLSHRKLLVIAAVSSIVLLLILSLIRSIKEPSEQLADAARRACSGNLDIQLDIRSKDEIGILAEAMNGLIERLREIIRDQTRMFCEIGSSNLDAKSDCEQAYRGDFAPLLYAFTSLQSRLKETKRQHEEEVGNLKAQVAMLEKRISEYEQK